MSHIFISYSREDKEYVDKLQRAFQKHGIETWVDEKNISSGSKWWQKLLAALLSSVAVVVVMTKHSESSDWVTKEIMLAHEREIPLIPIAINGKVFPLLIDRQAHHVTLDQIPDKAFFSELATFMPVNRRSTERRELGRHERPKRRLSEQELQNLPPFEQKLQRFLQQPHIPFDITNIRILGSVFDRFPSFRSAYVVDTKPKMGMAVGSFHIVRDSYYFQTEAQDSSYPLYSGRLIKQYTHRAATFGAIQTPEGRLISRDISLDELRNPSFEVVSRFWIPSLEVGSRFESIPKWLLAMRNIIGENTERNLVAAIVPTPAVDNTIYAIYPPNTTDVIQVPQILASLNSFICDYFMRQRVSHHIKTQYLEELPVYKITYPEIEEYVTRRVLELTYTAWDLQAFAADVGYDGPPFVWDEERRFLMRCELDALYFHLYQISRDDVDYILETFPIVKRKDIAATADGSHPLSAWERGPGGEGEYITKRIILEMYDQMAALPTMDVPHPKSFSQAEKNLQHPSTLGRGAGGEGEGLGVRATTYRVPAIRHWETWLSPPPADPAAAHEDTREA